MRRHSGRTSLLIGVVCAVLLGASAGGVAWLLLRHGRSWPTEGLSWVGIWFAIGTAVGCGVFAAPLFTQWLAERHSAEPDPKADAAGELLEDLYYCQTILPTLVITEYPHESPLSYAERLTRGALILDRLRRAQAVSLLLVPNSELRQRVADLATIVEDLAGPYVSFQRLPTAIAQVQDYLIYVRDSVSAYLDARPLPDKLAEPLVRDR